MSEKLGLPRLSIALVFALALFAVTFVAYGSSITHEFVTWDDMPLIAENPDVKAMNATTLKHVFTSYDPELYIPLTFVSYQADYILGGGAPAMFHITNIVLHALNAILVAWLLYLLIGNGLIVAVLALVFTLHPLNTEAVVWMSARKDLLSTFFFLASLVSYCLWRRGSGKSLYVFSLVAFLLALLSKVMVVTLPLVLFLIDALERRPLGKRTLAEKAPYIALSILFGIIALFGKSKILVETTALQKALMAAKSTMFYAEKLLVPTELSVMYPYEKSITLASPDFFLPAILTLALVAFVVWLWPRRREIAVGILFFLLTLVPTFTNFAKGGDLYIASDRYAYIPMIGVLFALGWLLAEWLDRSTGIREYASKRKTLLIASAAILIIFFVGSVRQSATWRTSEELYKHVLRIAPGARAAHNNLGMEYYRQGKSDAALAEFDLALAIRKDPRTRANKAAALLQKGLVPEAEKEYLAIIAVAPDLAEGFYGLGNIEQRRGNLAAATEWYRKALDADPMYTNALNNLGAAYIQMQDWNNAIATLVRSIELQPAFVEAYYNLGGAYERSGKKTEAEAMYRKSLELKGDDPDALASLASLVYDRGEIDEAAQLLRSALQIDGSNPIAIDLVMRMKRDGVAE